jgi:hypothetical protein
VATRAPYLELVEAAGIDFRALVDGPKRFWTVRGKTIPPSLPRGRFSAAIVPAAMGLTRPHQDFQPLMDGPRPS